MTSLERQVVMSRQTRAALVSAAPQGRQPRRSEVSPLQDDSELAVLLRVHRRLATRTMALLLVSLLGLPLVLSWLPDLTATTLLEVPVVWLLLGLGGYPLLFLLALWHTRQAERVEESLSPGEG
jgi:hypothetical protein